MNAQGSMGGSVKGRRLRTALTDAERAKVIQLFEARQQIALIARSVGHCRNSVYKTVRQHCSNCRLKKGCPWASRKSVPYAGATGSWLRRCNEKNA